MSEQPTIREARPDDIPELLEVLRAALGETPLLQRTPELFGWKHRENPFGMSIVLVATIGDRLAGVRALMRWQMTDRDGHTLECVRPVDTATHPDFRRRGIFRELTLSALEVAKAEGIDLVFNTPNPQSAPGYLSMGWKDVGWIGAMIRPKTGRVAMVGHDGLPSAAESLPGAERFHLVPNPDRRPLGLRTRRTDSYLTWRFKGHPTAEYVTVPDPGGGIVVARASQRRGRTETVVADLLGGAGSKGIRATARISRSRYMATWFSSHSPEARAAWRGGMIRVPGLKVLRLVALPLSVSESDIFDLAFWDLAVSDLELL